MYRGVQWREAINTPIKFLQRVLKVQLSAETPARAWTGDAINLYV